MGSAEKQEAQWLRKELAAKMREQFNRVLPLDEMMLDRWNKAQLLGFGEKSSVYENVYVYGRPEVGKNVWVGPFVVLDGSGGLRIGDGCDISSGTLIFTHSTDLQCVSEDKLGIVKKSVDIGNYVYLGSNSIVLAGVSIGHHSIIGAGAVVTRNIPAFSVAVGVPARVVGKVVLDGEHTRIEFGKVNSERKAVPKEGLE